MVVICDFHSQGRGSIPRGGAFKKLYSKTILTAGKTAKTLKLFTRKGLRGLPRRVATQLIEDGQRFAR